MDTCTQPTWTSVLAKELSTHPTITDRGKAGLPEGKSKQIQNVVLWTVLWENLSSWTTEAAEGVQLVCLGDCNLHHHNYS